MKILILCLLPFVIFSQTVSTKDWPFENADSLQNSVLNLADKKDLRELLHWQMYKYTLLSDSILVPEGERMVLDSTVQHFIKYDTAHQSKALAITRRDSFHITYHHTQVQDSVWKVALPTFTGFMEWKLAHQKAWIYIEPYAHFWKTRR